MRKRNTILILGILAILFIIIAQAIILRGLWKQQNEMLTLRYRSLTQEANVSLRGSGIEVHDTVWFILPNRYSQNLVKELPEIKDEQKLNEKKKEIIDFFTAALEKEQDFTAYLSSYFEGQGFEKNFNYRIALTNLEIITSDSTSLIIFRSDSYVSPGGPGSARPRVDESKSSISVLRQRLFGNDFSINFDYYIDFSDKRNMVVIDIQPLWG